MRTSDLHNRLLDAMLEVAWGQWTAMGVAGLRAGGSTIIDPEALVIATMSLGRRDPRLFDEMLDWLASNAQSLDMARLRRLGKRATDSERRLLGAVAEVASGALGQGGGARSAWAGILAQEHAGDYQPEILFSSRDAAAQDWVARDGRFERAGFLRPVPELRGMSLRPNALLPACLRFKARALAGPGAKAEVLTYLWTHEWAHGRLIAERAAYNQAPVADVLSGLAGGGLAEKRSDGRRTLYRLTPAVRAVGAPSPGYVDWVRVWPALTGLEGALRADGRSDDAVAVALAEALGSGDAALGGEGVSVEIGDLRGWATGGVERLGDIIERVIDSLRRLSE